MLPYIAALDGAPFLYLELILPGLGLINRYALKNHYNVLHFDNELNGTSSDSDSFSTNEMEKVHYNMIIVWHLQAKNAVN